MKTIIALVCGIATSVALFAEVTTDCYWHWMNGNVSMEGITADLEYMKAGGIEAAMIFDVGIGAKRGKVDYASAEWKDCVAWASHEAERLGMELSLHNSPGYSACGGPWIAPEESMKQLVWIVESSKREGALTGGSGVPPLRENGAVHFCNKRRDAASPSHVRLSCFEKRRDAASPSHDCYFKHGFYREIARYPLATADETIDIDKRLEKGESVELALDGEKEIAALNVWRREREKPLDPFDGPRDYGCILKAEAFDGAAWHAVGDVRCPTLRARDVPGFLRLKSPARATRLRLTSNRGANLARVEVISSTLAEGRELVIGYTTTGQKVTAAPDAGIGLECDKFSRRGVDAHFDRHLDPLFANCGKGAFRYLVIDSWEAGKQDWTDDFAAKFKARCGYDCIPWLPALTGRSGFIETAIPRTASPETPPDGRAVSMKPPETLIDWFVVQGPGVKTGREGLEVRFNRHGFEGYRAREIVLAAVYPGDGEFRRSVQQAIVRFPLKAREGKVERPNGFYIREVAALVDERGEITFLPLPPRAKRPAFVTLCAYERKPDGGTIYEFRRLEHP